MANSVSLPDTVDDWLGREAVKGRWRNHSPHCDKISRLQPLPYGAGTDWCAVHCLAGNNNTVNTSLRQLGCHDLIVQLCNMAGRLLSHILSCDAEGFGDAAVTSYIPQM